MPHRLNRTLLLLVGSLAAAAGILGLLLGLGAFGDSARHRAVFDSLVGRFLGRDGVWAWPVLGLVGLVLAYLGLRWLLAQLRSDRAGDLDLEPDRGRGRTELSSTAATQALTREVAGYRGVTAAHARLLGDPRHPDLVLAVSLDDRASVPDVRAAVETRALARFRAALDIPDLQVRLDLRPTGAGASRAR